MESQKAQLQNEAAQTRLAIVRTLGQMEDRILSTAKHFNVVEKVKQNPLSMVGSSVFTGFLLGSALFLRPYERERKSSFGYLLKTVATTIAVELIERKMREPSRAQRTQPVG